MGLRCSCGVLVPLAVATPQMVFFLDTQISRTGTGIFTANVCADRPELGTVTIEFVDTSGELPNRSFTFASTNIATVTCTPSGDSCIITVTGTGVVAGGGTFSFSADYVDGGGLNDDFINFNILPFAQTFGELPALPPGSVIALGCGTV